MPVIDDRLWSHPKWTALSDAGFRAGIIGISYAHEHITRGHLSEKTLRFLGVRRRVRNELVTRHVWDARDDGDGVQIHNWSQYNDDDAHERKRELGRERSRRWRARNASRNGDGDDGDASHDASPGASPRARAYLEEEELSTTPLPPRSGGNVTPRQEGTNPRTQGTNPRAVADRDRTDRRRALIAAAANLADTLEQTTTDVVHEHLDQLEREHHAVLADSDRTRVIDHYLARFNG
jgi:hypothetical protein